MRYEVREAKIICPYSMILMTLSRWTPIDGSKVFQFGRLQRAPVRHFVLLDAHGMPAIDFSRTWLRSLDGMVKDVTYCEEWFSLRKDSLVIDILAEWVMEAGYGSGGGQRAHGVRASSSC